MKYLVHVCVFEASSVVQWSNGSDLMLISTAAYIVVIITYVEENTYSVNSINGVMPYG